MGDLIRRGNLSLKNLTKGSFICLYFLNIYKSIRAKFLYNFIRLNQFIIIKKLILNYIFIWQFMFIMWFLELKFLATVSLFLWNVIMNFISITALKQSHWIFKIIWCYSFSHLSNLSKIVAFRNRIQTAKWTFYL